MTGIVPLSGTQQFDVASSPPAFLNAGKLFVYNFGTTTPAAIYQDFALTTPHASPIILDTAGRIPAIYAADGQYRLRLLNSASVLQFDDDHFAVVTAAVSSTPLTITSDQLWSTGHILVRFDDQPYPGYVRCNGRTIGSASSGATERANVDTQPLFLFLWSFANISIVGGQGGNAAADWAANKQLTLPDCAGRLIGGRDNLGNGPTGRITGTTIAGPTLAGAVGGEETHALSMGELAAHNHALTAAVTANPNVQHTHDVNLNHTVIAYSGGSTTADVWVAAGGAGLGHASTVESNVHTHTLSGSTDNNGSNTAHNNMPPVMLFTVYLKL